jgi:D-alanyl-D-alanine carboxypeptidase (penicillin-binding protein 5/6)
MMSRIFSLLLSFVLLLGGAPELDAAPKKSTSTKKKPAAAATAKPKKTEPVEAYAAEEPGGIPKIRSASAIVVDANSGRVLHEINADQPRPVASTQKLLTGLLIAEAGNLDQSIYVQPSDTWAEPSKLYIKPGDVYSRYSFLQILLVKSMNDVARSLARDNAGSVEAVRWADECPRATARHVQLALRKPERASLLRASFPRLGTCRRSRSQPTKTARSASIVNTKSLTFRYADGRVKEFSNTNRVLKNFPLCNGMKTGYTDAAGFCLISSGSSGGRDVVTVVLGGKRDTIWTDSYRLLAWALSS